MGCLDPLRRGRGGTKESTSDSLDSVACFAPVQTEGKGGEAACQVSSRCGSLLLCFC